MGGGEGRARERIRVTEKEEEPVKYRGIEREKRKINKRQK